jgi:hypothetical protein
MAKHKVTHHKDGTTIEIKGNPKNPEPTIAVIKFPGGNVEVSRTSDGQYWAHITCVQEDNPGDGSQRGAVVSSRIDYTHEAYVRSSMNIPPIPHEAGIAKIAVRVGLASEATL